MREKALTLACALVATGLLGCGVGAPPPTPISFLRQVPQAAAQPGAGVEGAAGALEQLVAAAAGDYGVTRNFHANICGFSSHMGEGTVTPAADNRAFGFRMHTDAEGLNDVEYSVTLRPDGAFTAVADAAPHFRALVSGHVRQATIEFVEEIEILDEASVCHGQTVQALVTASKH